MSVQTRFEVQTSSICDGWTNSWFITDKHSSQPETFARYAEAEAEINDFLEDIQLAIEAGDRSADEGYGRDEFHIVEINRTV